MGKNKIIRLTESDLHNAIKESINRVLLREYMSVSDEVNKLSAELFKLIVERMTRVSPDEWEFIDDYGEEYAEVEIDIKGTQLEGYADKVICRGLAYYRKYIKLNTLQENCPPIYDNYFDVDENDGTRTLLFSVFIEKYEWDDELCDIDESEKKRLYSIIQHELLHAFQYSKNHREEDEVYKTAIDFSKHSFDSTIGQVKNLYYFFELAETNARFQEIYQELKQNGGNLEQSKTYIFTQHYVGKFESFLRRDVEIMDYLVSHAFNNLISTNKFIAHCKKGIKKWNSGLRKIITRIKIENEQPN